MRLSLHSCFAALIVTLLTGCLYDKRPIEFSSDYHPTFEKPASIRSVKPTLSKAELAQVELEVFSYLLSRDWDDDKQLSAIFITGEESLTQSLVKKFPHHVPAIKPWWHLAQHTGLSPVDTDTGRAALVLTAEVDDPEDGTVIAIGKWFAGDAISGFHTFELKQASGQWRIQSVK